MTDAFTAAPPVSRQPSPDTPERAAPKRKVATKKPARAKRKAATTPKAPRAKQVRRGPAALSLDAATAFEIAGTCKKKDMAAINVICQQLSPLNRGARARVWHAVQMILG